MAEGINGLTNISDLTNLPEADFSLDVDFDEIVGGLGDLSEEKEEAAGEVNISMEKNIEWLLQKLNLGY